MDFQSFLKHKKKVFFSFDIFAATFFLLTRYEEALPHIKTPQGFFDPTQSIAGQYDFLELPVVDLWVDHFQKNLTAAFPEFFNTNDEKKKSIKNVLIEVLVPFRYKHRSLLVFLSDFFKSLWAFNLLHLFEQLAVLFRIKEDPFNTFETWKSFFKSSTVSPKIFFLFSESSSFQSTVSIFNLSYQRIIKIMSDLFSLGLLVSVKSQSKASEFLGLEKNNFESLTHKPILDVRMSSEIQNLNNVYESLVVQEFNFRL